jgi:hypothetical protein
LTGFSWYAPDELVGARGGDGEARGSSPSGADTLASATVLRDDQPDQRKISASWLRLSTAGPVKLRTAVTVSSISGVRHVCREIVDVVVAVHLPTPGRSRSQPMPTCGGDKCNL